MIHPRRHALVALALLALFVIPACGSSAPEVRRYQLSMTGTFTPGAQQSSQTPGKGQITLTIDYLSADAAYDDERMVYRTSPYQLNYYYYHRWASPPGLMVTDFLRQAYAATDQFKSVTSGFSAESDVILGGRIAAIEEMDFSKHARAARVRLDLTLRDTVTGEVLWRRQITEQVPMKHQTPEAMARAVSEALLEVVKQTTPPIVEAAKHSARQQSTARPPKQIAPPTSKSHD